MLLDDPHNRDSIDLFRSVGIVLVVCFHVTIGIASLLEGDALADYVDTFPWAFNIFWQALGSEIIFLFSGFLLAYLLLREQRRSGRIQFRAFYLRRLSRIVPLYYLAIAVYALVRDFGVVDLALNLLFVSELFPVHTIVPVAWSLEVLVQSYVLMPLAIWLLLRSGHPVKWLVLALVVFVGIRYHAFAVDPLSYQTPIHSLITGGDMPDTIDHTYDMLVYRATPFLLGILLAFLVIEHGERLSAALGSPSRSAGVLATAAGIIVASGFLPVHDPGSFIYRAAGDGFWLFYWTAQRLVFSIGIALLALVIWYGRSLPSALLRRFAGLAVWQAISRNIYSIYLFHPIFLIPGAVIAFREIHEEHVPPVHLLEIVATITIVMMFSVLFGGLLTRHVEQPAQRWIRGKFL